MIQYRFPGHHKLLANFFTNLKRKLLQYFYGHKKEANIIIMLTWVKSEI
jgi:hypothetical protein